MVAKIAIDNSSKGILIANNIFCLEGDSKTVLGDQYKPDESSGNSAKNVFFKNNLFLNEKNWPENTGLLDVTPIIGNPKFKNKGGINIDDYIPMNKDLIMNKGINISLLANDTIGLRQSLNLKKDILGNYIGKNPSLGAIEP